VYLKGARWDDVDWIHLAEDTKKLGFFGNKAMTFWFHKMGVFLD
jgi:hypothetical protein